MDTRSNGTSHESDVIQLERGVSKPDNDQLDTAGQTILQLIHRAAGFAEENSRHALEMAQKLSHQLQAAEARVAELEAEVDSYREKADRAEQWLHRVYTEIEDRFLRQSDSHSGRTATTAERKASLRLELVRNPQARGLECRRFRLQQGRLSGASQQRGGISFRTQACIAHASQTLPSCSTGCRSYHGDVISGRLLGWTTVRANSRQKRS